MEMVAEEPAIASLAAALEQATQSAKQLPNATHPSQIHQIYSTLHSAHHHLSSFLSQSARLPPPTLLPHHHHPPPLNSVSSPVCSDDDDHEIEPMQVGDGDEEVEAGQSWKPTTTVEVVEERMRDCFIQNKRPKRPLSPSSAAVACEQQEVVSGGGVVDFDPHGTRLRSLKLVYQFHS